MFWKLISIRKIKRRINHVLYKLPITANHNGNWEMFFIMIMFVSFNVWYSFNSAHVNQIHILPILYYRRKYLKLLLMFMALSYLRHDCWKWWPNICKILFSYCLFVPEASASHILPGAFGAWSCRVQPLDWRYQKWQHNNF